MKDNIYVIIHNILKAQISANVMAVKRQCVRAVKSPCKSGAQASLSIMSIIFTLQSPEWWLFLARNEFILPFRSVFCLVVFFPISPPPHTHRHPHPKTCSRDVEAQVNVITSEVWLFLARKSQPNSSQPTIWLSSASSNLRMQMKSLTELRRLNRKEPKLHNYKSLSSGTLSP